MNSKIYIPETIDNKIERLELALKVGCLVLEEVARDEDLESK